MIPQALSLTITTPLAEIVKCDDVRSFRAEDESGSFGIQPGHIDLLSALVPCVVRWQDSGGNTRYCAVHGGILTVIDGRSIRIACREAIVGDGLEQLEADVRGYRQAMQRAASSERIAQARLHARAIRQIMQRLSGEAGSMDEIFK